MGRLQDNPAILNGHLIELGSREWREDLDISEISLDSFGQSHRLGDGFLGLSGISDQEIGDRFEAGLSSHLEGPDNFGDCRSFLQDIQYFLKTAKRYLTSVR